MLKRRQHFVFNKRNVAIFALISCFYIFLLQKCAYKSLQITLQFLWKVTAKSIIMQKKKISCKKQNKLLEELKIYTIATVY